MSCNAKWSRIVDAGLIWCHKGHRHDSFGYHLKAIISIMMLIDDLLKNWCKWCLSHVKEDVLAHFHQWLLCWHHQSLADKCFYQVAYFSETVCSSDETCPWPELAWQRISDFLTSFSKLSNYVCQDQETWFWCSSHCSTAIPCFFFILSISFFLLSFFLVALIISCFPCFLLLCSSFLSC